MNEAVGRSGTGPTYLTVGRSGTCLTHLFGEDADVSRRHADRVADAEAQLAVTVAGDFGLQGVAGMKTIDAQALVYLQIVRLEVHQSLQQGQGFLEFTCSII